ncbi:flagellin N-terminal helical domain-containing protein [Rubinisphaera margarita]|uniref:flagellin N-terminal helical domain-containing protein n=1 Tax=Rubinisphaera margarita TaxID=2909586 RepID=UPI001EE7C42A|nr:flagellin [Rubinisphaera margarita]MCG6156868.1 hypothetical protein [Rubinisphaera margarita]
MSLGPILPGRIPNSLIYNRALQNLDSRTRLFSQLQDQIATGQKFQTIGEDPTSAVKTILLQQTVERQTQTAINVEVSRSLLSATEGSLSRISDVFNSLQSHILSGLGDATSESEKKQLATEIGTMIQELVNVGNTKFRGRYLFGGTENTGAPFAPAGNNDAVRFSGSLTTIESFVALEGLMANNVSADSIFSPTTDVNGSNLNPSVTAQTRIKDLFSGSGVELGTIEVTVDTGGGPQTEQIDLKSASSIQDLITRMEAPFGGDLSVSITSTGITLTPAAGTVAVTDLAKSNVAGRLGIASTAAASINSTDLDPRLTRLTPLAALNGGTGIGPTAGNGILVTNGINSATVDLDGLTTVEDFFNALKTANIDVEGGFTADGRGLKITSRLSGVGVSIGENGGNNAQLLGIKTFSANTSLAELNDGRGVPVDSPSELQIVRRDGSELNIELDGAKTVQDVLDLVNAADPGVLTASLNTTGNGIVLSDTSGTGALTVIDNAISEALKVAGVDDGNANLTGTSVGATSTTTTLASLNAGAGVPVGAGTLDITRRDGSVVNVDLSTAVTVQDVLDLVNAVDPGNLVMTHNATTKGFELNDNSGTGSLTVAESTLSTGLGIAGTEDGVNDLVGSDPNTKRSNGLFDLMFRLRDALDTGNNQEIELVSGLLETEMAQFNIVRGDVGGRLQMLDRQATILADEDILLQESISNVFDVDMALAITQFANLQVTIQASQQIAAQTLQLNLFNYL